MYAHFVPDNPSSGHPSSNGRSEKTSKKISYTLWEDQAIPLLQERNLPLPSLVVSLALGPTASARSPWDAAT
ncbi:hypothetical protein RvY_09806 [Ramazzottius varieornatus]|uniref:Uncharacterized protein n=1 Tax=Ramazzottius varieornatus TaxID=947166 RepID=A0A1D1VF26_RAMVA|nr:hypothetical protein RvY_09806 [Ramazzottius varieornatus]